MISVSRMAEFHPEALKVPKDLDDKILRSPCRPTAGETDRNDTRLQPPCRLLLYIYIYYIAWFYITMASKADTTLKPFPGLLYIVLKMFKGTYLSFEYYLLIPGKLGLCIPRYLAFQDMATGYSPYFSNFEY